MASNPPNLQNQYGDSWLKIATKGLYQKVCLVFYFLRPRKTADPLPLPLPLPPIQNQSSTALSQPLLVPTPLICSPKANTFEPQTDLGGIDVEEAQSYDEIVEEIPPANSPYVEESVGVKKIRRRRKKVVEELEEESVGVKKRRRRKKVVEEEEVGVKKKKKKKKKEEVGVKKQELNVAVDDKERRLKHYSSHHKILLVGEADFSFSACLAMAFASAPNIIATSLNSKAFLKKNYGKAMSNIAELKRRGSKVMHGIDATEIANHKVLRQFKFDRIIFNFPFAGFFPKLSTEDQLRRHRRLVSLFLKNAKEMISENGEIHISHKTDGIHADFNLESIASSHGLRLIQAVKFKLSDYPGYDTKLGFGGDVNFPCYPSKTFKFGLKSMSTQVASMLASELARILRSFMVFWHPPEEPWIKLNTDGSYDATLQKAAGGGLVRDHAGHLLAAFCTPLCASSSFDAELQALLFGIEQAVQFSTHVWVEMDSLPVISLLNSGRHGSTDIRHTMSSIKLLLRDVQVKFSHIFREGNRPADFMARRGRQFSQAIHYDTTSAPRDFLSLVRMDQLGCPNFRFK